MRFESRTNGNENCCEEFSAQDGPHAGESRADDKQTKSKTRVKVGFASDRKRMIVLFVREETGT